MRWDKLGVIVGLAVALVPARTFAVPESSLLASAQPVAHIRSWPFCWINQQVVFGMTSEGQQVEVNRRTQRRKYFGNEAAVDRCELSMPSRPEWLPKGAKIVSFDSTLAVPKLRESVLEVWVVAWPVKGVSPQAGGFPSGGTHGAEARYGVWITGPKGTKAHLLGVAPLSRQEFEALKYEYNPLFLPDHKEVSFVYRGVLYVMPVSSKPVPVLKVHPLPLLLMQYVVNLT